jgi:dienelactone hydrolase
MKIKMERASLIRKIKARLWLICLLLSLLISEGFAQHEQYPSAKRIEKDFRALLKRPNVDFRPSFQIIRTDSVIIERGYIYSEQDEKVPMLLYKPLKGRLTSFPVMICLHGTGGNKEEETIKGILYRLSKDGIMGVAIDARYHGERIKDGTNNKQEYVEAIRSAWISSDDTKQQYPFFYDTVYDLWRLMDYLITRSDVQQNRIGMMGISMGGIHTWMAASVDKRIKVAVPIIAIQSFKWSLDNNQWQGRARTIWPVHEQAAKDLGDSVVNQENVRAVWRKLLPNITDKFDCPAMIRLFAPRPLLLLNNEKDKNCPLQGAQLAFEAATEAYKRKDALHKLNIHITPNAPHRLYPEQIDMMFEWISKWL